MAVKSSVSLIGNSDIQLWQKSLSIYKEVVSLLSDSKTKRKKGKPEREEDTLVYLDKWYQEDLPKAVLSRDPPHLTAEELCSLMKWKLTELDIKGNYSLLDLNYQTFLERKETVTKVTKKAYSILPNIRKAIETLTQLKAVGPATASAILCIVTGDAPFMSDESTQSVPGLGQLNYSLNQYTSYTNALKEQARDLGETWDPHKVELALWSYQLAAKLKPDLLSNHSNDSAVHKQSGDSKDLTAPPTTKRQKIE